MDNSYPWKEGPIDFKEMYKVLLYCDHSRNNNGLICKGLRSHKKVYLPGHTIGLKNSLE